jgi:hypothetical protein
MRPTGRAPFQHGIADTMLILCDRSALYMYSALLSALLATLSS